VRAINNDGDTMFRGLCGDCCLWGVCRGRNAAARGCSVCHNDAGFVNNDKCAITVDKGEDGR
jgi:hypothetical protein